MGRSSSRAFLQCLHAPRDTSLPDCLRVAGDRGWFLQRGDYWDVGMMALDLVSGSRLDYSADRFRCLLTPAWERLSSRVLERRRRALSKTLQCGMKNPLELCLLRHLVHGIFNALFDRAYEDTGITIVRESDTMRVFVWNEVHR